MLMLLVHNKREWPFCDGQGISLSNDRSGARFSADHSGVWRASNLKCSCATLAHPQICSDSWKRSKTKVSQRVWQSIKNIVSFFLAHNNWRNTENLQWKMFLKAHYNTGNLDTEFLSRPAKNSTRPICHKLRVWPICRFCGKGEAMFIQYQFNILRNVNIS